MRKAAGMLARLEIPQCGDGRNKISLLLPNGSRIVGLPDAEAKIRGFSAPSMVVIDEIYIIVKDHGQIEPELPEWLIAESGFR
jgi:hypothetical protein